MLFYRNCGAHLTNDDVAYGPARRNAEQILKQRIRRDGIESLSQLNIGVSLCGIYGKQFLAQMKYNRAKHMN